MRILLDGLVRIVAVGRAGSGEDAQHQRILRIRQQSRSPVQQRRCNTSRHQVRLDEIGGVNRYKRMSAFVLRVALWNRNYFFRFRFWLLKSYGSGSDSDFWHVTVPAPVPDLVSRPLIAVFKFFFFNITGTGTFFLLIEAALMTRNLSSHLFIWEKC